MHGLSCKYILYLFILLFIRQNQSSAKEEEEEVGVDVSVEVEWYDTPAVNSLSGLSSLRSEFENKVFILILCSSLVKYKKWREGDEGKGCGGMKRVQSNPPSSVNVTHLMRKSFWRDSGKCGKGSKVSVNAKCNVLCTMKHPGDVFFLGGGFCESVHSGKYWIDAELWSPVFLTLFLFFFLKWKFYCVKTEIYTVSIPRFTEDRFMRASRW